MPPTITRDYAMRSGDHLSQKFWGILKRKERWGFSWRGWLLVISAGLAAAYFTFLNIHPFLAVTNRVNTNVLVVEGSIQRYAIRAGAAEFKNGSYERIFMTGASCCSRYQGTAGILRSRNLETTRSEKRSTLSCYEIETEIG